MTQRSNSKSNPFATRFTRPGELDFIFADDGSVGELVRRLQVGRRWQIAGPHGTGKTTLLRSLIAALETADLRIRLFILRDGQSRMPIDKSEILLWDDTTLLIIDGFEQLGWLQRKALQLQVRRRQARLLVTSHSDLGWPMLYQSRFDESIVRQIIDRLSPEFSRGFEPEIQTAMKNHQTNIREVLFELFDVWNRQFRFATRV